MHFDLLNLIVVSQNVSIEDFQQMKVELHELRIGKVNEKTCVQDDDLLRFNIRFNDHQ